MSVRLLQHRDDDGRRRVVLADGDHACFLADATTVRALAWDAIATGRSLADAAAARRTDDTVDIAAALAAGRLCCAIDHDDPARLMMAGTGLTHLGSAAGRDAMHKAAADAATPTDSMRMFLEGVEGGKPVDAPPGSSPNGSTRATGNRWWRPVHR